MSERGRDGELRVLVGGKRGDVTAAEVVDTLTAVAGHLREGTRLLKERSESTPSEAATRRSFRDVLSSIRGSRSARSSGARPVDQSRAPDSRPKVLDRRRLETLARQTAYHFGRRGAARREVFGRSGSVAMLVDGWLDQRIAEIRLSEFEREAALRGCIASAALEVDAQRETVLMHDRRSAELRDAIATAEERVAGMVEEEQSLAPARRRGSVVRVEAATAMLATGLADCASFLLAMNAVGGALWLRVGVATTVALALTVALMAAGRTLTGLWLMMRPERRWLRASFAAFALAALCLSTVASLTAIGSFRNAALANIDRGVPPNPDFLVWTAITSALAAVLMLAWWHYSSAGGRLLMQQRQVEARVAALTDERARCLAAIQAAQGAIGDIVVKAERAAAELKLLSTRTERLVEHERSDAALLLAVAEAHFKRGKHELHRSERVAAAPTFDPDMEREIDRQLDVIMGGEDRSLRAISEKDETGEEESNSS